MMVDLTFCIFSLLIQIQLLLTTRLEKALHNCLCLFDDTVWMLTFVVIFPWLPNDVYDMPAFPAQDCFLKLRMVDS